MYNNGRKGLITLARDAEYPIRFQRWPIKRHNPYRVETNSVLLPARIQIYNGGLLHNSGVLS